MVTSMLEKAIEIEGLLRIIRDGDPLPETYILLNMKTAELAEQAESLEEQASSSETETPHADFVMAAAPEPTPGVPEVVFSIDHNSTEGTTLNRTIDALTGMGDDDADLGTEDLALIEEDDIILTFEETPDESYTSTAKEEADDTAGSNAEPEEFNISIAAEEEAKPDPEAPEAENQAPATTETPTPTTVPAPQRPVKLRAAFSLNDRFLYARELFNGNMKMFDSTLDFLEGIEDYSIIEDYFYSELEWNPEDSNVTAFMEILRPHFKE